MRLGILVLGVMLLAAGAAQAARADKYVSPKKEGVGVYENEVRKLYEQPLTKVGTADRLLVLEEKRNAYKVDASGTKGWVDKSQVVATGKS